MFNLTIAEQRRKAIDILVAKYPGGFYQSLDYLIDEECRKLLNLPPRPDNADPYVQWMMDKPSNEKTVHKLSPTGVGLIKSYEGCKLTAYKCPAGVWTIGYGHTRTARPGMTITQAEANRLFEEDVSKFEASVRNLVKVTLNQGQYDALVSLCYNIGAEALRRSSLLRFLNQGRHNTAALELLRFVYAGKQRLPGLVARRNKEYDLFIGK
jgi:lysozyme